MNNDLKDRTATGAARRRLIRGVFAAPAALTLCSGSVYAATSTQACLANAVERPVDAPPDTTTWLRVEVWKLSAGNTASTWVWGDDLKFLRADDTPDPYLTPSQWQCLSSAGNGSGYTFKQVVDKTPSKGNQAPQRSGTYVAVRVDAQGKIIGIQGIETGGTAVSLFCWESLAPSA